MLQEGGQGRGVGAWSQIEAHPTALVVLVCFCKACFPSSSVFEAADAGLFAGLGCIRGVLTMQEHRMLPLGTMLRLLSCCGVSNAGQRLTGQLN